MASDSNIHVYFPPHFIAIRRYPGYFYHLHERVIYSIKYGVLKPLQVIQPNKWSVQSGIPGPYVRVSHEGISRVIVLATIEREIANRGISNSIIPVKPRANYYT